jgi:large subunit ribosomal protein L25
VSSDKIVLPLVTREQLGKKNQKLRAEGRIPAVVYGHGDDAQAVSADAKVLERAYASAGGNKIIGLKIDDARQKNALIHEVQTDFRGNLLHADFYLVRMDEKIKTEIPLHFTGESTAVYQDEGTLVRNLETVEVEALPGDLPESFEVDISVLDDFEKTLKVSDLQVPAGVEIVTEPEALIAKVDPPISAEALAELEEPVTEELPEGVQEDVEVVPDDGEETRKEPENKADGAD